MTATEVEQILVVPTARFHDLGYFQGFCDSPEKYISDLFNPDFVSYKPRPEMEEDPSFKQLIPYVVFRYQTPDGETQLFSYARGKGQGESRLHDKWSIGIGGHISSVDNSENEPYRDGMRRELEEEVMIDTPYSERCVGLINDDESEVGKVHLGVVHIFDVDEPKVESNEDEICEARFRPVDQLLGDIDKFETWSQISLKALFPGE
ncbi:NUDIX domain-containing protein [bacterium]|jgi:predicted NUDIX family phosphoesterase|nr:NUDIX domain-containing protein [bacterium]